ncbi:hypothetical protein [Brevundimonas sp. UBA2416]|uniref:hypothetical protein n=1 Tax=Brevundimonas sp. UBA2416 TaxID=1946124 RepID=UPI0025C55C23|nr:hypothetical protein [Brevundimonas sp. UBA2416]
MSIRIWTTTAVALALVGCSEPAVTPTGEVEIIEPMPTAAPAAPVTPASPWTYTTDLDPMTDRPTHVACSTSTNMVRLQSPYSDVAARLCVRQSPQHGLDVYVALLGDGQIICRSYNNCSVNIRFGDGEQQSFSATDAADGSSNIIFVTNAQRFVTGVKGAPVTRIQLTFYQAGVQVVEFNTSGLEWPRPST